MKCLVVKYVFCQDINEYIPLRKCEECKCYKHLQRINNELVVVCDHEKINKNKK